MISKLAKDIFLKETRIESVIAKIDEFSNSYTEDKKTIYESLSTELMKLKKRSIYLNSEATRISIVAEIGGFVHYLNSMAKDHEVLVIIGPKSLNFNKVLIQVNNAADASNNEDEYEKKDLPKLKKGLLKDKIDIHFRHEYINAKNISRLSFLKKQGDEISKGESIGFFEDYEFTATAMEYMTKYNLVDSYCKSKIGVVERPERRIVNPRRTELEKKQKLQDVWDKNEIDNYKLFIDLLQKIYLLPEHTPEMETEFIKIKNQELRWVKSTRAWQSYIAGLLRACNEFNYIELNDFSTKTWMAICKNTFLESTDKLSQDAFDKMRVNDLHDKYIIPFMDILNTIS